MADVTIKIDGMSCQHCVGRVKKAIEDIAGVEDLTVTVGSADVKFNDGATSQADIEAVVQDAGYSIVK